MSDHATKVPANVLLVYDGKHGPTATQKISFGQPFEGSPGSTRIHFADEPVEPAGIPQAFETCEADLLVLSRYTSERGLDWIAQARHRRIPVIFHIDDDLLAVPESLGAAKHRAYNDPARLNALRQNIESSDLLYVSTRELKGRFLEHGIQTPIVAGDVYCSVDPNGVGALVPPATGPVVGYMGTGGHSADLAMIIPAICEVMDEIPDLQFEVFGTIKMPSQLEQFGSRTRHLAPVADYADFLPHLRSLGWWIGLAPLEDNIFNRCKADTKWVEYSLAGMAVIASDLPVYHRSAEGGAAVLAATQDEWKNGLLELLYRPALREEMIARAQERLRDTYTHDHLRRQVLDTFAMVAGSTPIGGLRPQPQPAFADAPPRPGN